MLLTPTSAKRVAVDSDGPVAHIDFTHPPLNVFDFQMMDELTAALQQLELQRISTVVLSGGERAFSAGVDVAVHTPDKIHTMFQKFHGLILALTRLPKITIAEVHGACLGGGAELAMVCDMCFTTHDAKWGFPEITLGCYPPVACTALAAVAGEKRAADLIFTGRTFSGTEAAEWGLANSAHSKDEIGHAIQDRLDHLCTLSPVALAHAKKAFYAWDSIHLDKGLARAEKIYVEELMQTEDAKEGIQAWLEKRKPNWKGK
jgi:cyclohexa-1,5-dienecarbonyl-CoA hydratase